MLIHQPKKHFPLQKMNGHISESEQASSGGPMRAKPQKKESLCSIKDLLGGVMLTGYGAPSSFAPIDTYPKVRYWL